MVRLESQDVRTIDVWNSRSACSRTSIFLRMRPGDGHLPMVALLRSAESDRYTGAVSMKHEFGLAVCFLRELVAH